MRLAMRMHGAERRPRVERFALYCDADYLWPAAVGSYGDGRAQRADTTLHATMRGRIYCIQHGGVAAWRLGRWATGLDGKETDFRDVARRHPPCRLRNPDDATTHNPTADT